MVRQRVNILENMLEAHLAVGESKPVSYLPIETVEGVLGIPIGEYCEMIARRGNVSAIFQPERSCIESGAVFAYSPVHLDAILAEGQPALVAAGWPTKSRDFIERLAAEWLDEGHPILPIVRQAFGDSPPSP